MALDFGGDDITQFLHTLLMRTGLPYRDADLSRWYDFTILEDLKERMVVLSEVRSELAALLSLSADLASLSQADVGLNLYDFYVRVPGKATRKYKMRIYDDVILAPYARRTALSLPRRPQANLPHFAGPVRPSCRGL
jgi:actin-related protein 8